MCNKSRFKSILIGISQRRITLCRNMACMIFWAQGTFSLHLQKALNHFFAMSTISFWHNISIAVLHVLSSVFHTPVKEERVQSSSIAVSHPHKHFLACIREIIAAFYPIMLWRAQRCVEAVSVDMSVSAVVAVVMAVAAKSSCSQNCSHSRDHHCHCSRSSSHDHGSNGSRSCGLLNLFPWS